MKEWQVFKHLESCPGPSNHAPNGDTSSSRSSYHRHIQPAKTFDRLPAINYSMLKDQALRKKLSDLGISNTGPRPLLEKRHREWITLWNANCDASRPKKSSQLLQDLDVWERTQGGRAPTTGRSVQNAAIIKDKDFDGKAWAERHDDSFRELILNARKGAAQRKKGKGEADRADQSKENVEPEIQAPKPPSEPQTSADRQPQGFNAMDTQDSGSIPIVPLNINTGSKMLPTPQFGEDGEIGRDEKSGATMRMDGEMVAVVSKESGGDDNDCNSGGMKPVV